MSEERQVADQPAGPLLDALGVTLHLEDDQQLVEAMVIGKVVRFGDGDPETSFVIGNSVGLDWITQRGLVVVAADALTGAVQAEDDE